MKQDRVGLVIVIGCLLTALVVAIASPTEPKTDSRITILEQRMELLKERCDDFQYTVNRVNALEATQQHQQEALDTIDWAMKYRY